MIIRKAVVSDIKGIHKLVNEFAHENKIIPRSLNDLFDNIRDIFVCYEGDRLVGTCALHVAWEDLAEIRSLVVERDCQKKGIGKLLIEEALNEARELGIGRVFSLTYIPGYFARFGFLEVDKSELPHKVWADCMKCHKFPDCDEIAVIREFKDI